MRQLGNAAHLLGIRPWEWDLMTVEQTDQVLDWLDTYKASMDEAEEKMRRG
ncbi:hypothetical protein ACFXGT_28515 [Streptomyces sp. NPDC059352]|uniref:hypothetical protein n=1 Tax=Streptomyces sp. NPDC059352 TaxID=3346810 RepID=UPI00369366D9